MHHGRRILLFAAGLTVVLLAGCGGASRPPATQTGETTRPPAATTSLSVYLLRDGKLTLVHRRVPRTPAVGAAALHALLAGPTHAERDEGITSAIPSGTRLLSLSITAGLATVNLSGKLDSPGSPPALRQRAAQIVFTLTQFPSVRLLRIEIGGAPWRSLAGLDRALGRPDFELLAPPIIVESPAPGDTVRSPVAVHGTADAFEATFAVRIVDRTGRILHEQTIMATTGSGQRGSFSASVPFSVSDPQRGALLAFEYSAADGSVVHLVRVPLQLVP